MERIQIRNEMFQVRERYFFHVPEFEEFEGDIVPNPSWVANDCITMTTGNSIVPFRIIRKDLIVGNVETKKNLTSDRETVIITSSNGKGSYTVVRDKNHWTCTCTGFAFRRSCKHITEAKNACSAA
jgi:hypothetical protein